jgi:ankyrin repeat protein
MTPLAACMQPAHVKLLLAAGADAHVISAAGNTCLHTNSEGKTAAQVATECGNTLTASLLIRAAAGP